MALAEGRSQSATPVGPADCRPDSTNVSQTNSCDQCFDRWQLAFQSADETIAYVMGKYGPVPFTGFSNSGDPADLFYQQRLGLRACTGCQYDTIYERGFAEVQRRAVDTVDLVNGALEQAPVLNTVFPQSQLGNQLRTVAADDCRARCLQMERQVFLVETGGFDTHDDQVAEPTRTARRRQRFNRGILRCHGRNRMWPTA